MSKLLDFNIYPVNKLLKKLLKDKTTNKNIIWATNTFEHLGREFDDKKEISDLVFKMGFSLSPRISKSEEEKLNRTRNKAEVFTPSWIVNEMNNVIDEEWFGRDNVFNKAVNTTWETNQEKIEFPKNKNWKNYVKLKILEISCGEAPYLVSRYDASSGEIIENTIDRIGVLDRKLRIVSENTDTKKDWINWATKAVESIYGYEYQGDNLLIARVNILLSFVEFYKDKWEEEPEIKLLTKISNIISWNIWQMDGLKDTVPHAAVKEIEKQLNVFDILDEDKEEIEFENIYCKVRDWRKKESSYFIEYKENDVKKFDFVIGNPPYQNKAEGTSTSDDPIYNYFMDESYKISEKSLLITPARFLFNAGKTPKSWNKKMLNDEHFKVIKYVQKSTEVFKSTDIKGGIAISYYDNTREFEPIIIFSTHKELNSIRKKVVNNKYFENIMPIIETQSKFNLDVLYEDYPEYKKIIGSNGRDKRLRQIIMERLPELFTEEGNFNDSYKILGLIKKKRAFRYIKKKYIEDNEVLHKYKVFVPAANGSGAIGEVLSTPLIGEPLIGNTQTFISFGRFDTLLEADAMLKYIKTKFCRTLLGTLKITQGNNRETWANVPLQDFTDNSDIDWSKSIAEIDMQLYKKYNLSQDEIEFIETNVKEME